MAGLARVFKNKWISPPKPVTDSFEGRIVIVTGATSGIGEAAVLKFAALGASKVVMAAQNLQKGEATKKALTARLPRADQLEVWELDMLSYSSVALFAQRASQLEHLDIVVLNAGVRRAAFEKSQYGWEQDLQINTLSTTLLAILLLPKLKTSKQDTGRTPVLEFVNSGLHQKAIVPAQVRHDTSILAHYNKYDNFTEHSQYSYSKVFLMYVSRRLADDISSQNVIITSTSPGLVMTNLGRDHYFAGIFMLAFLLVFLFMRRPEQGANSIISGTIQGEILHGRFWQHDKIQPVSTSLSGPEMKDLGDQMWHEIVQALEKDVPDIRKALEAASLQA
ncbi:hypothetical protein ACN47E_010009 [Coniothyrium glycines]